MSGQTIYVSHTLEDRAAAERLKGELKSAGFTIAVNMHSVPAGLRPKPALQAAMAGAVRFLACFSSRYGAPTEYEKDELSWAIEHSAGRPADEPWLIPVKLTACEIPALQIVDGKLSDLAAVDLHRDWTAGMERLIGSLPPIPPTPVPAEDVRASAGVSRTTVRGKAIHIGGELEVNNNSGPGSSEMVIDYNETTVDGRASFVNNKR